MKKLGLWKIVISKLQNIILLKIETACLACIIVCFVIIASVSITFPLVEAQISDIQSSSNVLSAVKIGEASPSLGGKFNLVGLSQVAVSGNDVYVVWNVPPPNINPGFKINFYLSKSTDGGATFSTTPLDVNYLTPAFSPPDIAVSGTTVYLAWVNDTGINSSGNYAADIFIQQSTDGGATFGDPIIVKDNVDSPTQLSGFSVDGNYVYVQWGVGNGPYIARSIDGGNTFDNPIHINDTSYGNSPLLVPSGGDLFNIWWNNINGKPHTFLQKSTDGGNTFSDAVDITNFVGGQVPSVSVSKNTLYFVWSSEFNSNVPQEDTNAIVTKSTDEGKSFSNPVTINNIHTFGTSWILSSDKFVYVLWNGIPCTTCGGLHFAKSTDGGATFSDPIATGMLNSPYKVGDISSTGNLYLDWESWNANTNKTEIYVGSTVSNTASSAPTVPEFPFTIPILLVSFVSVIAFYRIRKYTIL